MVISQFDRDHLQGAQSQRQHRNRGCAIFTFNNFAAEAAEQLHRYELAHPLARPTSSRSAATDLALISLSRVPPNSLLFSVALLTLCPEQVNFVSMIYNVLFAYGLDGISYALPYIAQPTLVDRTRLSNLINGEIQSTLLMAGAHPRHACITTCCHLN
jgi:hypothetical protein